MRDENPVMSQASYNSVDTDIVIYLLTNDFLKAKLAILTNFCWPGKVVNLCKAIDLQISTVYNLRFFFLLYHNLKSTEFKGEEYFNYDLIERSTVSIPVLMVSRTRGSANYEYYTGSKASSVRLTLTRSLIEATLNRSTFFYQNNRGLYLLTAVDIGGALPKIV